MKTLRTLALRKLLPKVCGNSPCRCYKAYGHELIFISWIKRDGSGVEPIKESMSHLDKDVFTLQSLSITNKTFIASEFNSYVVKLKINP